MALLFILVCGVALLQSRLIKAAGHWTQHGASAIQLNNSRNMSRTCTSAAELFYLRHTRSCAATACGNKGSGTSHSTPLQMSGADFIARLLQSVCQQVCLTIIMHWGRALLALFRPSARLLQSIGQMVRYYAKIAMKLIIVSSAMLRDMLTWFTPLELAACFHLVEAYMHRDLYTYHCESDHCRVSAVSAPSAQKIATIALQSTCYIEGIRDPSQAANYYSEAPRCTHELLASNALHTSCRHRCSPRLHKLRLPRRMYSSRAAARTQQLPCRSTGPRWKLRVHNPGSETTATDDNQNSKHNPYATRRDSRSWPYLPLEIPTLLLRRAAVAGHIRGLVQASFSGAADICRSARRAAKDYREWAARRHSIKIP